MLDQSEHARAERGCWLPRLFCVTLMSLHFLVTLAPSTKNMDRGSFGYIHFFIQNVMKLYVVFHLKNKQCLKK